MPTAINTPIYKPDTPAIVKPTGQDYQSINSLLEQRGLTVEPPTTPPQPKQSGTILPAKNPSGVEGPKNFEDLSEYEKQLIADDILANAVVISQVDKTTAKAIVDNLMYFYGLMYKNLPFNFNQIAQSQNPIEDAFSIRQKVLGGDLITQMEEPNLGYLATKNEDIVTIKPPVKDAPSTFIFYKSEGKFLLIPEVGMFAGSSLSGNPYGLPGDINANTLVNNLCNVVPNWQTNNGEIVLTIVSAETPQGKELTPRPQRNDQGYIDSNLFIVTITTDEKYYTSQTKIVDQEQPFGAKSFATSILSPQQSLQRAKQQVTNDRTTASPIAKKP